MPAQTVDTFGTAHAKPATLSKDRWIITRNCAVCGMLPEVCECDTRYSHCNHCEKPILDIDDAVEVGSEYYYCHKGCVA